MWSIPSLLFTRPLPYGRGSDLSNASFQTHSQQLLGLHGKLHGEFAEDSVFFRKVSQRTAFLKRILSWFQKDHPLSSFAFRRLRPRQITMEKRFLLAFGLSLLVLMAYSAIMPKPQHVANKYVVENSTAVPESAIVVKTENTPSVTVSYNESKLFDKSNLYEIKSNGLDLTFTKLGGFLLEAYDKETKTNLAIKNIGYVKGWGEYLFQATEIPRGVVFSYKLLDGNEIQKTFQIVSDHSLDLSISIKNITNSKISSYDIFVGYFNPATPPNALSQRYFESSLFIKDIVLRKPVYGLKKAISYEGDIAWAGVRDRYFCAVLLPQAIVNKAVIDTLNNKSYLALSIPERNTGGVNSIEDKYKIYIGPQNENYLKDFGPGTERIVNYGTFDTISKALLFLLVKIHDGTHSWGLAIILVTILIYFILFPLSYKSMLSMKKMQAFAAKILGRSERNIKIAPRNFRQKPWSFISEKKSILLAAASLCFYRYRCFLPFTGFGKIW